MRSLFADSVHVRASTVVRRTDAFGDVKVYASPVQEIELTGMGGKVRIREALSTHDTYDEAYAEMTEKQGPAVVVEEWTWRKQLGLDRTPPRWSVRRAELPVVKSFSTRGTHETWAYAGEEKRETTVESVVGVSNFRFVTDTPAAAWHLPGAGGVYVDEPESLSSR